MKKQILIFLLIMVFATATAFAVSQESGPAEVKFPVKMGTVTFNHAAHQALGDCASCHHTGDNVSCKSCHGVDPKAPKAKKAFHAQCIGCHKEMKQGPAKCKECHIK